MATESGRRPTGTSRGAAGAAGVVVREARPDEYEAIGRAVVAAYRAEPVEEIAWYYDEIARVAARAALVPVLAAVDADGTVLGGVTYVPGPGPFAESEAP
ncbi:MAG TPA: hypothetical protein VIV06_02855, partial [Candidatus Limnocylindrales bacterium]